MGKFKNKRTPQKQTNDKSRGGSGPPLSRKQKRKDVRKNKKAKKHNIFLKKHGKEIIEKSEENKNFVNEKEGQSSKSQKQSVSKSKESVQKLKEAADAKRKKMLIEANKAEDKIIQKLGKDLNMTKKGKGKKSDSKSESAFIPKSFQEDGLGYILEACDSEKMKNLSFNNMSESENEESEFEGLNTNGNESESDLDDDLDDLEKKLQGDSSDSEHSDLDENSEMDQENSEMDENPEVEEEIPENLNVHDNSEAVKNSEIDKTSEDENSEANENSEDDENPEVDENSEADKNSEIDKDSETDENSDNEEGIAEEKSDENSSSKKPEVWEDIYGRTRDSQGGVIQSKYVPPALRAAAKGANKDTSRLEKQLKGQLNRLAESNMQSISRLIEDMYARNSRNDMNECLVKILKSSILLPSALIPERLVMEHAMLIGILHANVGSEVGAMITQSWIESFMTEYDATDLTDEIENTKILENYLYFACCLYAFHVYGHDLIFNIFTKFVESYKVKDVELIILLLRCIGFNLRKDDPTKLKNLIVDIQKKATQDTEDEERSDTIMSGRTKFMLDALMAIKNNNVKKLPNYDPSYQVHLHKIMKTFLRPGADTTPLNVKLEDLLSAETRGRWWIVGSAWSGRDLEPKSIKNDSTEGNNSARFSEELLTLARKYRMNTDSKKVIFCTVMSANDYMDAFEKLCKLKIKSPLKEEETSFVLTKLCVKEPQFNPFYPHVASKLARSDRKFRMSIQCAIWDRTRACINEEKKKSQACVNLALFTSKLIRDRVLTMTCLKKIEFADMNSSLTLFLRTLLRDILKEDNDTERNAHFALISGNDKLSALRESLRLFMHHFLLKSKKEKDPVIKSRVESAENALLLSKNKNF